MNSTILAYSRLINQQIAESRFSIPQELVSWMGALQAQNYNMVKWAIGVRLPGLTKKTVEAAIADGDIIRTHLLRPTWHFVAADDIRWMLRLTAPQIKKSMRSRHKQLGISNEIITRSRKIIEQALSGGKHLTRKKLVGMLERGGIDMGDNRASHLLLLAELDEVICCGPTKGKNYTYRLMDERIPESPNLKREEALAKLGQIYFRSHGPATLEDFSWWSGLTITDARKTVNLLGDTLNVEEIDSKTYYRSSGNTLSSESNESTWLLPAYDEFIIGYKDRDAVIAYKDQSKAISNNGIFRPIIVVDGQVTGIWKRISNKDKVMVETQFFEEPSLEVKERVECAAKDYSNFLEKEPVIEHMVHTK